MAYWTTWSQDKREETVQFAGPFVQVTNREFSLFLWQNPEFMRVNVSSKTAYLPAFNYLGDVTVEPGLADQYVQAPPNILFLYQTWLRLLGDYYIPRTIGSKEFLKFLSEDPQWEPKYWKEAPPSYDELLKVLREGSEVDNLNDLNQEEMPVAVKKAFIGWKNYTHEGQAIDQVRPTWLDVRLFLLKYPNYGRSHWINFVREKNPNYLLDDHTRGNVIVESERMTGFFKVAIYNYLQGTTAKPSS